MIVKKMKENKELQIAHGSNSDNHIKQTIGETGHNHEENKNKLAKNLNPQDFSKNKIQRRGIRKNTKSTTRKTYFKAHDYRESHFKGKANFYKGKYNCTFLFFISKIL